MPASITQAGSRAPLGQLATYDIAKTNIPHNPTDSSGQIPTFSASFTNPTKDAKTHLGDSVVLTDLSDTEFEGSVVAAKRGADSGLVQLDMNTVFERLNTHQTTFPVYGDISWDTNMAPVAIEQWLLMAGIPKYRVPGNLLHYVTNQMVGYSSRTEATWVQAPTAEWVPNHTTYIPTYGVGLGRLDVNRSQSFMMGMPLSSWDGAPYNSEVRVNSWVYTADNMVRHTLMQVGKNITLDEKLGTGSSVALAHLILPDDVTVGGNGFVYVLIKAHPTLLDRVSITMKVIATKIATGEVVTYSTTTASVASQFRKRPELRSIDLGYDTLMVGTDIAPTMFFISEGDVLPDDFPKDQVVVYPDNDAKPLTAIPGFSANVWEKLKELCSLVELDIAFTNDQIIFSPRKLQRSEEFTGTYIPLTPIPKSGIVEAASMREKARSVEVNYYLQPKQNVSAFYNTELWRADSVYSLDKGETLVEKVQTDSTFLTLKQPVPVSGVPVPYTNPYGAYVVTGADGYIVDPQWWADNGGSINVQPTEVSGEIQITFQAPTIDTARAPYRISEGVADRPALYLFGHGLKLEKPKTLKVYTGNPDAAEDVGTKVDSIFITNKLLAFNTGHKVAAVYGSGESSLTFSIPRKEDSPEFFGGDIVYREYSADHSVYHNGSVYRIEQYSVGPSQVGVSKAPRFNTHRIVNGEYATGKTIADLNALHSGKKIKDTNLAPLPNYLS